MRCKTDGTENHCVSSAVRMNSASLCGSRFSWCGTRWSAAPAAKLPNTSKVERSKCSGACPDVRSSGPSPNWRTAHSMKHVTFARSEEHTSELQSHSDLVCRLLLEKKKKTT